jgi:hypothetical protein
MQLSRQEVMRSHPHVRHRCRFQSALLRLKSMNNESSIQQSQVSVRISNRKSAYEKLRPSVRAVPLALVAANWAAAQPLLYSIFRIGTDLALAPRYRL